MHRFLLLLLLLVPLQALAFEQTVETNKLVIVDESRGQLNEGRFRQFAGQAEQVTDQLLAFWSVELRIAEHGKICVKFQPPNKGYYGAQTQWEPATGRNRGLTWASAPSAPSMGW
jgi:hypothetical protein